MNRHRFFSTCGNYVYHIAIIDYLTKFNWAKKGESFYKVTIKGNKAKLVSCVEPGLYGRRFINFMKDSVIVNETKQRYRNERLDKKTKKECFRK